MIKPPQLQSGFRISTSTRLMMVVMLFLLSGGFVFVFVHSFFSPNAIITRGITIYDRHKNQQRFSRQRRRQQQQHQSHGYHLLLQSLNSGSSDTLPPSSSSSSSSSSLSVHSSLIQQGETVLSLEWIEFFAPKIKTISEPEQLLEQQHTPVLFLHGLLGSKRNFATLGKMLGIQLDKPRRILGIDLRNHGDTLPWSESMSYPQMAKDVINFLDSQNIRKVVLVGHSMGGKIAQALALLYPEYVEGLVVIDIAPVKYSSKEDPHWRAVVDIMHAINDIETTTTDNKIITKRDIDLSLRQKIPDPALRAFVLTNFDSKNNQWKIPISTIVDELEQIAGFDLELPSATNAGESSSSSYEGDVFIINGGQSRFVRHAYMDQIASFFPNHMLTTIRGAGHWVHAEAPDDTVALIKRYLDR
jgi:esterase